MPVTSNDWCFGFTVQKTVEFPQLHVDVSWCSSSTVVDVPVLTQRHGLQFSDKVFVCPLSNDRCLGLTVQKTVTVPQLQFSTRWSMSLSVQFIDRCVRRCDYAATSVLDRALSWGEFCCLGYVRVAIGALNVESQCSWAAVPVFAVALTMFSRSLVGAKMQSRLVLVVRYSSWEY